MPKHNKAMYGHKGHSGAYGNKPAARKPAKKRLRAKPCKAKGYK